MTNDLTFAGNSPVIINRNGDTREIFAPIKSSSCDITIVSNKILSDLYTNDKKGICVKVEKVSDSTTSTLFEGYMTHNTYSQTLSPNLDNINMTAIDPLALLKYIYIDDILEKSKTISMGELIAKALAAVKIDCNTVWIEDSVEYKGDNEKIKFVDMLIQTNNFWDESGDADTVYDALSECLRLFGYQISFTGERYMIYLAVADHTFGTTYRYMGKYRIEDGGTLTMTGSASPNYKKEDTWFRHSAGEWTTIDENTTLSIDETYDRISGVASTKIPNYSLTAFDMVSSEERDKYDVGAVNIQRNKIKGYNKPSDYYGGGQLMTEDEWYYIWNGVYINEDYNLKLTGVGVNGYANINNAYSYLTGQTGHPSAYGGLLNFYGGEDNPVGTGKEQAIERAVEVKECITVFADDNGTAPEFLEKDDLKFSLQRLYETDDDGKSTPAGFEISKINGSDSKFGSNQTGEVERIAYKQKYENITMSKEAEQTLVIDLTHSYSRTGINKNIAISNYSNVEGRVFGLSTSGGGEDSTTTTAYLKRGTAYTYPLGWQSSSVVVNRQYFKRYDNGKPLGDATNMDGENYYRIEPVWDKRRVVLSVVLSDGTKYQFNGKEWVETETITMDKGFFLKKLMNNEKLFHTEYQYDMIECADGETYSLNEDGLTIMFDGYDRVVSNKKYKEVEKKFLYYGDTANEWMEHIDEVSEGRLAIILPAIDGVNVNVSCSIYTSNLLGMTGNTQYGETSGSIYYPITGTVEWIDDWDETQSTTLSSSMCDNYGKVVTASGTLWMPVNATYIKAEHLDLDISMSVPESNLGQMFGESDIKYQTAPSKRFRQSFEAPDFKVNTKHPIVSQSHSYVIIDNSLADPNKFSMGWQTKLPCRPENYVLQGYKNFYGTIRKTYNRVLVPHKEGFGNCLCYIEAPDISESGDKRWLVVVSDSVDVRTNRHTISAVQDYGMNVETITNYTVIEVPRKARNDRYNLPSVKK